MPTINLSKKEHKLLLSVLEEVEGERSDMGCNDPYPKEERIFTSKERKEMRKVLLKANPNEMDANELEELGSFLFNHEYVGYLLAKIKK